MKKVLILGGNGLVGSEIVKGLNGEYEVVSTAGHHEIEGGYTLLAGEDDKLMRILVKEKPDVIVSSIVGAFDTLLSFHRVLGNWCSQYGKRLIYISTTNVFDGDLSAPVDENTTPVPESDYGKHKLECENMLVDVLGNNLAIMRLNSVWTPGCKRVVRLMQSSENGIEIETFPGDMITVTLGTQIGEYAKYIIDGNLSGVFHVGSEDMVDYHQFELMVCDRLHIRTPLFKVIEVERPAYQAFLPTIRDIPQSMRRTVDDVLDALSL